MKRHLWILVSVMGLCNYAAGMIYDNRYFPWYDRLYSRTREKPSMLSTDLFFVVATQAILDQDDSVGIPEIWGIYNQNDLANAMILLGFPDPLSPEFSFLSGRNIIWQMKGSLQGEGIQFDYHQHFANYFTAGMSFFFLHNFSKIDFGLGFREQMELGLTGDQVAMLDRIRRQMQEQLGLLAPKASQVGISDIDLFLRIGNIWDYTLKFKRIDAGARIGALIPTGKKRDPNNPASVPFGGNGHWGVYGAIDAEFEVKEDWKAGLLFRLSKRFPHKSLERIPIAKEQPLFGAVLGNVRIDPGLTVIFSPYFQLEDIRDGLGVQAKYTIVAHQDDLWEDARAIQTPPAMLQFNNKLSEWRAEYISVNIFYDFARVLKPHKYAPTVWASWDIPVSFFVAERVSKTNRIELGLSVQF